MLQNLQMITYHTINGAEELSFGGETKFRYSEDKNMLSLY